MTLFLLHVFTLFLCILSAGCTSTDARLNRLEVDLCIADKNLNQVMDRVNSISTIITKANDDSPLLKRSDGCVGSIPDVNVVWCSHNRSISNGKRLVIIVSGPENHDTILFETYILGILSANDFVVCSSSNVERAMHALSQKTPTDEPLSPAFFSIEDVTKELDGEMAVEIAFSEDVRESRLSEPLTSTGARDTVDRMRVISGVVIKCIPVESREPLCIIILRYKYGVHPLAAGSDATFQLIPVLRDIFQISQKQEEILIIPHG